jgi:FKBP-type peptidyl-prolyl cis-trans isomerase
MLLRRLIGGAAAVCVCVVLVACEQERPVHGALPPNDVAEPPADATRTESGLAFRVLAGGHGTRHPGAHSRVEINYTAWTTDGTIIEAAPVGSDPVVFDIEALLPGLQEGVRMMVAGEKRRFWIPPSLANEGRPDRPQGMLVYDVTLVRCSEGT